jgi:hypothetical protein
MKDACHYTAQAECLNRFSIKIASLFCTLYVHYEKISSVVALCDGIAKKHQAILRSSE